MKDWTIMIYMAGDNNLSVDMSYALEQIKSVTASTDRINLFVYFDGYSPNIPTLYCDFSERDVINYYRSFMVKDKLIKRNKDNFNENSASVNNVINFVDWCVNKVSHKVSGKTVKGRKAERYAMIFSGHSFGFQSQGLFKDEKADYHMTLRRLRWMFERITYKEDKLKEIADAQMLKGNKVWSQERYAERTSEIIGKELSILGFDSCVMSMMEIGCQFRNIAETLIASEGSIPNAGWSYSQMLLGKIVDSKEKSSKEIAASFVENFITHQNKFALADLSVDLAAWDLKKLAPLESAVYELVVGLLKCFENENSVAYKQMKRILIQTHWQCQTYMFDQNIDLGDFCKLLSAEIESLRSEFEGLDPNILEENFSLVFKVGEFCKAVIEKLLECVILCGFSGGEYQFSNGISLFFPWSWASYGVSQENYESLSFVENNKAGKIWNKFLQKYLSEISIRRAKSLSGINDDGTIEKDFDNSIVYNSFYYVNDGESDNESVGGPVGITDSETKIPVNGSNKIPVNGSNKIPVNGSNKIPVNGSNKIPVNGSNKIPVNGTNKLFNAFSLLFSEFMITKNVESFWNHSGFTSKEAQFLLEKKKDEPTRSIAAATANPQTTNPWIVGVPGGDQVFTTLGNPAVSGVGIKGNFDNNLVDLIENHDTGEGSIANVLARDFLNAENTVEVRPIEKNAQLVREPSEEE